MKKVLLTVMVGLTFMVGTIKAQDIQMSVLAIPGAIVLNKTGVIQVDLCNIDANPVDAPANKLRPVVSVGSNVEITGITNLDGSPLTGFTIQSQTATTARVLYNNVLPNAECVSYLIQIKGTVVSDNQKITGTLGFNGPPTPGNSLINDVPTTGVEVIIDPLPVTLVSFNAKKEGTVAQLDWATTAETNSDRFEIERSLTGKDWNKIGTVASNGESSVKINYSFSDTKPANGENLYRLKMIDKDATFAYSRIQRLKFEGLGAPAVSIYPNPSADKVFIQDTDLAQVQQVSILDMNGRALLSNNKVTADGINVSKFNSGTYILHITNVNGTATNHKIVIAK